MVPDLGADLVNGLGDVVPHDPVGSSLADLQNKALEHGLALNRMGDLGMKLHRIKAAGLVSHASYGAAGGGGHELKTWWQVGDLVAMAHPDLQHAVALVGGEICDVLEQSRVAMGPDLGIAKLPLMATLDLATQLTGHGLHAITDAQDGQAEFEDRSRCLVGGLFVDTGMGA